MTDDNTHFDDYPAGPNITVSKGRSAIINFVKERRKRVAESRGDHEAMWDMVSNYYDGYQNQDPGNDARAGMFRKRTTKSFQRQVIINRMFAQINRAAAMRTTQVPQWHMIPASNEESDKSAAHFHEQIMEWYWLAEDMEAKMIELNLGLEIYGSMFVHVGWDRNAGPSVIIPGPDDSYQRVPSGLPVCTLRSPMEIYPDPSVRSPLDFHKAHWLVDVIEQDVDDIFQETGIKVEPTATKESLLNNTEHRGFLQDLWKRAGSTNLGGSNQDERKHKALRYRYFEKPGFDPQEKSAKIQYPRGRYIDIAGDKILDMREELPYDTSRLPYVMFFESAVPGRFWPTSRSSQLLPLQDEYNEHRSNIATWLSLMTRPRVYVRKGSLSPEDKQNLSKPGAIVETTGTFPTFDRPGGLPPDIHASLLATEQEMQFVGGQHASSHGYTSSGTRTASQEILHVEQDRIGQAPQLKFMATSMERMMQMIFARLKRFGTDGLLMRIRGKGNQYEAMTFKRADIQHDVDVRVDPGSLVHDTKAGKFAKLEALGASHLFELPPSMQQKFFDWLGLEQIIYDVDEEYQQHVQLARFENEQLEQGIQMPVLPTYDDGVHQNIHRKLINGVGFLQLPEEVRNVILEHDYMHSAQMMRKRGLTSATPETDAQEGQNKEKQEQTNNEE